jgi:predicted ArsR family transcriptional regulator
VKAVANFCGLTAMAVRRHLLHLSADRLIQSKTERRPRGRPAKVYSLTEAGDAQFPRDYAGLVGEIFSSLQLLDGKAKIDAVFRKRRSNLKARYTERVQDLNLESRVRETAAILTECGFMAEAQPAGPGRFLLVERNCAIRDVARCYPVACHEELCLIRDLSGGSVTRVAHLLAGDAHCSYVIERKNRTRAGGRRT